MILADYGLKTFFGLIRRWPKPKNLKQDELEVSGKVSSKVSFLRAMNFDRQDLEKYLDLGHYLCTFWVLHLLWLDQKVDRAHNFKIK